MALVRLNELRDLVGQYKDWEREGYEAADRLIAIELKKGKADEPEFAPALARKTITYEAREATVVLEFDDKGYLISLELV